MKINEIIDNLTSNQPVTSVIGKVVTVGKEKEVDGVTKRTIKISDDTGDIKVLLKGKSFNFEEGEEIELCSRENSAGNLNGLVFKEKEDGSTMLVATVACQISKVTAVKEIKQEKEEFAEEEEEDIPEFPPGPSDSAIRQGFLERLHIFNLVKAMNEKIAEHQKYPEVKLPELTTSILIDLSRANAQILPPRREERQVRIPNKKEEDKPKESSSSSSSWKNVKILGEDAKLGSLTKDEIISRYGCMFYRMYGERDTFSKEKRDFFEQGLKDAMKDFGFEINNAIAYYMRQTNKKIKSDERALQKASKYFHEKGEGNPSYKRKVAFLSSKEEVFEASSGD